MINEHPVFGRFKRMMLSLCKFIGGSMSVTIFTENEGDRNRQTNLRGRFVIKKDLH